MTEILYPNHNGTHHAATLLRQGGIVAFGTETVYGLGALSTSETAVRRIFSIKGRPAFNPLINHFSSAKAAFAETDMAASPLSRIAQILADRFWPGPLTLVLPRHPQSRICTAATAGLPSIALRVPKGEAIRRLLEQVGGPIAAPSANISGRVSPSTAEHVLAGLDGAIDALFDTGPCTVGLESTILDLTGDMPVLLRPGGVTREALEAVCGPVHFSGHNIQTSAPSAPGQLSSHYAPRLPVRLNATQIKEDEALMAFGQALPCPAAYIPVWNLSETGDLAEAAARLFSGLRFLDHASSCLIEQGISIRGIAVQPFPDHGLGLALADRLYRAAAPRPQDPASEECA